jgi:hypothetical protein
MEENGHGSFANHKKVANHKSKKSGKHQKNDHKHVGSRSKKISG